MRYDLRFWAENISGADIVRHAMPLLSEFDAGVGVAVFAGSMTEENASAFRELKGNGVQLAFWPLLSRENGYFPGEKNVPEFAGLVRELVGWSEQNDCVPDMIAVDQEIPLEQMMEILETPPPSQALHALKICYRNLDERSYLKAKSELCILNSWIKARGIRTLSACLPWVALELEGEIELIQDMMETPLAGVEWDVISPMAYVSMISGMTGGLISDMDANWFTFDLCLGLKTHHPKNAGVSLGVTGTGVLENEPVFSEPEELLIGVEAALAAGIRDIGIYNLEGTISRKDPRAWFEALRAASPRVPRRSIKVAAALAFARNTYPHIASAVRRYV